jgi:preprotein translocase subunit SecD
MRLYRYITAFVLMAGCGTQPNDADPYSPASRYLSLHWVAADSSSGVRWYELPASGERVAVEREAVLGMIHFAAARTAQEEQGGGYFVEIVMTADGRTRMKELSSENAGRQLAIIVEGEVLALPMVTRTVDAEALSLPVMDDAEAADDLARRVNAMIAGS